MLPLKEILNIVCETCGITLSQMCQKKRQKEICMAKGLYFLVGRDCKYHPTEIGSLVYRSRPVVIISATRYRGYIQVGDKLVIELYNKIMDKINTYGK